MNSIKELLYTDDKVARTVKFVRYRAGNLWYATESGFEFPVPVADAGEATFLAEDKAPLFMRYIRKHLAEAEASKEIVE